MRWKQLFLTLCLLFIAPCVSADSLEVRRETDIFKGPDRNSGVASHIKLKEGYGPYTVRLLEDSKANGYYKVRLPGKPVEGWIYKTVVRRYRGRHPKFQEYKRSMYPHWIDEDGNCRDTRSEVLIRDAAKGRLEFTGEDGCKVKSGTWVDPYTGQTVHDAGQLDIDHVVPLKNAHDSGGWTWPPKHRREYANYLAHNKHLLAVDASENRKKGEKGPDRYLPPSKPFRCEYVQIWARVKEDWELDMTDEEWKAVRNISEECRAPLSPVN